MRRMLDCEIVLSLLGVPKPQRQQIENTYSGGMVKFTEDCVTSVLTKLPTHDSYILVALPGRSLHCRSLS